jgi:hypothetical protein
LLQLRDKALELVVYLKYNKHGFAIFGQ